MIIYEQPTGSKLENKSLGSKVADIIRERIITGEYLQGSRITEGEFAKAFAVSHSCIREAFGILESEGLIPSSILPVTYVQPICGMRCDTRSRHCSMP